ncbi:MAG: hypothetical protein DRI65_16175 [Chloroflexota bacterium]|nr:MAG: hypothetical protein DRI65_16175 [Chloroflexota bacterium]
MVFGGQNETGGLYDMALRCFFLAQHAQVKLIFRTFIDYVLVYVSNLVCEFPSRGSLVGYFK